MELNIEFPPKRGKSPTHVSMVGGVHYVPPDRENEFFRTYIELVKRKGTKLHLVEQCNTQEFKFFLDIDFKAPEALSVQEIIDLSTKISKFVDGGKCLVLISNSKPAGDLIKSGIHIVWFDYIVDLEEAHRVRDNLVKEMGTEHNWNDILDTSVYRAGIRLPWSYKYNKKTGKHESCYLPPCFLSETQAFREVSQQPDEFVLKLASVRVSSSGKREGRFTKTQLAKAIDDGGKLSDVELFIRNFVPGQKKAIVKRIMKMSDTRLVVDTNSRYCENKGGIHSGNRVYFVINNDGILFQRCFCKCDISRKKGFCNNFSGKKYKLTASLKKKLFD